MSRIKGFKPIPAGDWIIHVVRASRAEDGKASYEYEQHTVIGWGERNGCVIPFYWGGFFVTPLDEIEWYGTDDTGSPVGAEWSVLARGTEPDRKNLRKLARLHLRLMESERRTARVMQDAEFEERFQEFLDERGHA